jgi:hypothetical protein
LGLECRPSLQFTVTPHVIGRFKASPVVETGIVAKPVDVNPCDAQRPLLPPENKLCKVS